MNRLVREQLFVSLVNNAKNRPKSVTSISNLSVKNSRRVHKLRESKAKKHHVSHLKKQIISHKQENFELKQTIDKLNKTVETFSSTIDKHDKRVNVVSDLKKKQKIIDELKKELEIVKSVAIQSHKHKDIGDEEWKTISSYVIKLEKLVNKKQQEIDESLLL